MRPPAFWSEASHPAALALSPVGALYAFATARRRARGAHVRVPARVICVGNLDVGGSGKTPTVIALLQRLERAGVPAHALSRGWGGSLAGPVAVHPHRHAASEVGDEALLLAAFAPVTVARDRAAGARAAIAAGGRAIVMDDGFQDPALAIDLAIVVVDAARGWGNGRCLPAGPLREPVAAGLARADLVLAIGDDAAQARFRTTWGAEVAVPIVAAHLAPLATGMEWRGLRALAFAGIGQPEKFFATLRAVGADLLRAEPLADHQPLGEPLLARLAEDARRLGAELVTTEKDAARLPPAWRGRILTLPVRLKVSDWTRIDAGLGIDVLT